MFPAERRIAVLLGLPFALAAMPAQAQTTGSIGVSGYVAPRCWAVAASPHPAIAEILAPRGRAICNYATPMLRSTLRLLDVDGTPEEIQPSTGRTADPAQLSGRAALEITVSPHL
jgi:hypothetical protein